MKKTVIAIIIIAVLVLCGVSAYGLQGLDESKSTTVLADDSYATMTTNTVGGTVSTSVAVLQSIAANSSQQGLHVTDTYSVFSLNKTFIKSLLENVQGSAITFHFGYNDKKNAVTFTIRDENNNDVFAKAGRCVGKMPYTAGDKESVMSLIMVNGSNKAVSVCAYYPDAAEIHWQLKTGGTYTVSSKDANFADTKNHWAATYTGFLFSHGVASGVTDTTYAPDNQLTRAQFVTLLSMISMEDCSAYTSEKFTDVAKKDWFYPYVSWAVDAKITSGTSDTTFSPDANISREQMAVLTTNFLNYMGADIVPIRDSAAFPDADRISSWAKDSVTTVQALGIINGTGSGEFNPQGQATRAEAATVCSYIISYLLIMPQ